MRSESPSITFRAGFPCQNSEIGAYRIDFLYVYALNWVFHALSLTFYIWVAIALWAPDINVGLVTVCQRAGCI